MNETMSDRRRKAIQTAIFSILGNSALAAVKLVSGILGNSFALIADAIESITDIFSSFIVFLGLRYSTRSPDENHPYGHGKAEPLITFIVVVLLLLSASLIAYQGIRNILTPQTAPENFTLFILGGIILIKEGFYRFVNRRSKATGSTSLKADAWHHRSDAITSLVAFFGILISILFGESFAMAEDIAALVAAGIIVFNAYRIFRPALGEIMDENVYDEQAARVRKLALEIPGIIDTEKCYIRKSGMNYYVDIHIIVDANLTVAEGHLIGHRFKDKLLKQFDEISDVLVHIEPDRHI
jgi:cation diffusion facilitator family transporter